MKQINQRRVSGVIQKVLLLCFFIIFSNIIVLGQPLNMDTSVHPTELKLIKFSPKGQPKGKGWLNVTNVKQQKDTAYYFCKGLSIYSPAAVIVAVKDKSISVKASLHKWNWKETSRTGSTGDKGTWMEKFKTENDFGLMVVAPQRPAEYIITVWVGEEADMELPSDFKAYNDNEIAGTLPQNQGEKKSGQTFLKKNLLYLIIGILVVAVAFLLYKRKKRSI